MVKYMMPYIGFSVYNLFSGVTGPWIFFFSFFLVLLGYFLFSGGFVGVGYMMGGVCSIDVMSFVMIVLSIWITILLMISSVSGRFSEGSAIFCSFCLLSLIFLVGVFLVDSVIFFYIFFELCSLPTLLFIIKFGYQPERWRAGVYLILYTFFGSVPFFVCLLWWWLFGGGMMSFGLFYYSSLGSNIPIFFFLGCSLAFMVKLPIFGVHVWLPKAHVEAPIAGSMLLAGLLLKLGGYGYIRFMSVFMNYVYLSSYFFSIGFLGGLVACMVTFRQSDLKCFIAYSSVCHMSLVLGCLITFNMLGFGGALIMMLGHGFVSCSMFCMASLYYDRFSSRNLFVLGGLSSMMVGGVFFWFIIMGLNMGLPPFFSFWGELGIFLSVSCWWIFGGFMLIMASFQFAGVINLFYFIGVTHGGGFVEKINYDYSVGEYGLIFMLTYPVILMVGLVYFFV